MCVELDAVAVEVRTMVQQFSTPPPPMCGVCTQSAMAVELSAPYCAALGEMVAHYVVCTTTSIVHYSVLEVYGPYGPDFQLAALWAC